MDVKAQKTWEVYRNRLCLGNTQSNSVKFDERQGILTPIRITPVKSTENQIFRWFEKQQLENGLIQNSEVGKQISLYDNALAAMVFMLYKEYERAERIFDFFVNRIKSDFRNGVGGFSQFYTEEGKPIGRKWMGDNAWLLIALNNYKSQTQSTQYDELVYELSLWIMSLQEDDGGLFSGYFEDGSKMDFKVTEGNLDAFNAVAGYTEFHQKLLSYLKESRWDENDKNLVSWPDKPHYLFALDLQAWGYLMLEDFPVSSLLTANRFLTTQTNKKGKEITGYCFDEDKDVVWLEGTAQMALAFGKAGMNKEQQTYLEELEKAMIRSSKHWCLKGFSYTTNQGTNYGSDALWKGADRKVSASGGAWYLFAKFNFNPFEIEKVKPIPDRDKFWIKK